MIQGERRTSKDEHKRATRKPSASTLVLVAAGILGKPLDMRTDGRAPTLEAAKAEFEDSWRKWLAWARLGELNSE